jgi:Transcriptional regulator PadR-like family
VICAGSHVCRRLPPVASAASHSRRGVGADPDQPRRRPKHGYALIQDIKELAGVELRPGTLYGALDRLERLGLIESLPADDRRHPYRITAPGAEALRVHLDSFERVSAAGSGLRPAPAGA